MSASDERYLKMFGRGDNDIKNCNKSDVNFYNTSSSSITAKNENLSKELENNGNEETKLISREEIMLENICSLHGWMQIGSLRTLKTEEYFLKFKSFWSNELITTHCAVDNSFNFNITFSLTNNKDFLERVKNNNLAIEIWNKSNNGENQLFGNVELPLHQFFIAFRDESMITHLSKLKLPVISIDGWSPIISNTLTCNENIGQMEALLSLGTKEQIEHLKDTKGIKSVDQIQTSKSDSLAALLEKLTHQMQIRSDPLKNCGTFNSDNCSQKTSDLMDVLQKALQHPPSNVLVSSAVENAKSCPVVVGKHFKFHLNIESAFNLPKNPVLKSKKGFKKSSNYKIKESRYPPNDEPFAYVTFHAEEGQGPMVKSHEGMVYSTSIAEKSINPKWNQTFEVLLSRDYLFVDQKRFILKIWKKAATDSNIDNQPIPIEDAIIGFSAIDLSGFTRNIDISSALYNIVDFNGRINGQIKISAKYMVTDPITSNFGLESGTDSTLGRAMKRKFTELEEISQRLRARLFDVTGEANPNVDLAEIDDEQLDEFERDLNTTCFDSTNNMSDFTETSNSSFEWLNKTPSDFETGNVCPKQAKIKLISEFLKNTSTNTENSNEKL